MRVRKGVGEMTTDNRTNERETLIAELESAVHNASQARFLSRDLQKVAERAQQRLSEYEADVIQYGDPEPDPEFSKATKHYIDASGLVWYRTLLDGWRWRGECRFGIPWERIEQARFPLRQLVGTQLKERGLR